MENNKEQFRQEGSGSAENMGRDRSEQVNQSSQLSEADKQDIAGQIGERKDAVTDVKSLGQLSGRDDAAGGINDGMENQSTGETTDR